MSEIGSNVRAWRQQFRMSRKKLASIAEVHFRTIQDLERGGEDVKLSTLKKLAWALDLHPALLFMPPEVAEKVRPVLHLALKEQEAR